MDNETIGFIFFIIAMTFTSIGASALILGEKQLKNIGVVFAMASVYLFIQSLIWLAQ